MLRRKVLSLATVLVSLITSGVAVAQDATTPPPAAPPAAEPPPAAPPPADVVVGDAPSAVPAPGDKEQTEEIVVTGSRIRRKDLTTPAPVTVINRDQIVASGKVSLGDFLQALPEQGNAVNTQENNANDGSVRVDLRSLGTNRTLVLVNGRRFVNGGTGADASPDLLTIPAAAVERIEILKDGASAVYGSDAIAGVVNVILKKRVQGTEVSAYAGTSSEGDGTTYDLSALVGTGSERGNILFSIGYQDQGSIRNRDRAWATTPLTFDFETRQIIPTGSSSTFPEGFFSIPVDPGTGEPVCPQADPELNALCTLYTTADPDAQVNAFVPQPGGGYQLYDGSLYNTYPDNYIVTPSRRIQLFATGDTNIGDVARGFFEASYVNRRAAKTLAAMPVTNSSIPLAPVIVSSDSIYNEFGVDITSWRRRVTEFGDRRWSYDLDTFRVVTGLDGLLGDWAGPLQGWSWEVAYNWGRTAGTEESTGQLRMPNIQNAVGPSRDPDGSVAAGLGPTGDEVCLRDPADPTSVIAGCVPWDVLHGVPASVSPELQRYLSFNGTLRGSNTQRILSANTTGDLITLPTSDRPIGLALGVEHRIEGGTYTPDPITASLESSGNNTLPTDGQYDVNEGYAELSIPLLSARPGVHDLEATAAVRVFDYSTFGSDSTYKFGARWSPIRDVTLRGTFSTAFRAPNVGELYSGTADSYEFYFARDPCRNALSGLSPELRAICEAQGVPAGGSRDTSVQFLNKWLSNEDLQPETADIFTAGVVFEPRWVRNLSVTLDYYNMSIDSAIARRGLTFIMDRCFGAGDPAMCALITRDENGRIIQVDDQINNLYQYDTAGIDLAVRYGLPTTFGRFSFAFDGTWLQYYEQTDELGTVTAGEGTYDLGALPRVKFNSGVSWGRGPFSLGVATRYVGGYTECENGVCAGDDEQGRRRVASYMPFDVHAGFRLTTAGTTTINVGILNVADETPPFLYNASSANSDANTYDFIGRYVYARLTHTY